MKMYTTNRGHQLVHTKHMEIPVLTCELYPKWYSLYLIMPNGEVLEADLGGLDAFAEHSAVGDHCWSPAALQGFADARDWWIDEVALDLIMGRWVYNRGVEENVL